MKSIAALIVLISLPTFAAAQKEVIQGLATIRVFQVLQCVINPGADASFENSALTELDTKGHLFRLHNQDGPIELTLDHPTLSLSGCDLQNLNKLIDASHSFFGFAQEAPVQITRETEEAFINGFNQCVAIHRETVEVHVSKAFQTHGQNADLKDLVLTSKRSSLIDSDQCKKPSSSL